MREDNRPFTLCSWCFIAGTISFSVFKLCYAFVLFHSLVFIGIVLLIILLNDFLKNAYFPKQKDEI